MPLTHDQFTGWMKALIDACPTALTHNSQWHDWAVNWNDWTVTFDEWGTTISWNSSAQIAEANWRPGDKREIPTPSFMGPAAHLQALAYVAGCRAVANDPAWPNMCTSALQWLLDASLNAEYEPDALFIQDGWAGFRTWDDDENEVYRCRSLTTGTAEDRLDSLPWEQGN